VPSMIISKFVQKRVLYPKKHIGEVSMYGYPLNFTEIWLFIQPRIISH